jgi:hypothetical protein
MEINLPIRTYPRSGTHLVTTILHFYYGFKMPYKYSSYVKPIIGKGNLQMFTNHGEKSYEFPFIPEIYQLRNPIDCISSQFYRYGETEQGKIPNLERDEYIKTLPIEEIPKDFIHMPQYHTLWNEVGRYNHMLNAIRPEDCVLYYEDIFDNPELYLNTLSSYLESKYGLQRLTPHKSFQEILDFTAEYYDKSATIIYNNPLYSDLSTLKEKWKPVINRYLDSSNPYIQKYLK